MKKINTLLAVILSGLMVIWGAPPPVSNVEHALGHHHEVSAEPFSYTVLEAPQSNVTAPYPFVFDGGTTRQRNDVLAAIAGTDFDYTRIGTPITVYWINGLRASTGAWGMFANNSKIYLDADLRSQRAKMVFTAEAWHAVDIHILTTEDRQALMRVAHGGVIDDHTWFETVYADSLAETLMESFIDVYTTYRPPGAMWTHPPTPELAAELRRVLAAS